ncbi:MAG: hypothetical protein QOG50_1116 [Actinomycetota bacterium]|nr:hypothetical protein [Actinomycetota bacterium]
MRRVERVLCRASLPVLLVVGIVTTVLGNWLRVQNVDPQFSMVLVQRTIRFGGTFFDNALQDHGPIEPFLYDIAARVGGRNGAWYVISALVTVISLVLAYVAARTARFTGATREIGIAVGVAVFVHFTISRSNYAGVLYIRNMTSVLLAFAWLLMIEDQVWASPRRRRIGAVVVGCLLGLALQSLLSTFAAGVLGLVAVIAVWSRVERQERLPLAVVMSGSAFLTFVSAPVYYLIRGDFTEFWSGWVRYGHFMAVGPGRSTVSQLRVGWTTFVSYYEHRPLAWGVVLAFAVTVGAIWRGADLRSRVFHLGLIAWWIAAWVELVVSQRFSAEYFVVTSVPAAFMAAALAGHLGRALLATRQPLRALVVLPLVVAIVAVLLSSQKNFDNDVRATWHFRGVNANAQHAADNHSGPEQSALAVLDLVSHDSDPLLVWTNDPYPYLDLKRVAATRFFYKRFLLGEIYLGRTSTAYVLPETWRWFTQDLSDSRPVAYMLVGEKELPSGNPFADYVARNFDLVFPDKEFPVSLRHDVAKQVLSASATRAWEGRPPNLSRTGWRIDRSGAHYEQGPAASADDQLTLSTRSCFRLDGTIPADAAGSLGHVAFHFYDNAGKHERLRLSFEGTDAVASSDFVDFLRLPAGVPAGTRRLPFSLVVGRRSAALVIEHQVRAAVLLPKSVTVTAEATTPALDLTDLRVGTAPSGSGC